MNSYNVTASFMANNMGIKGAVFTVEAENNEMAILAAGYVLNPDLVKMTTDVIVSEPSPL